MGDVDHPHVDVVQLHCADNLTFSKGGPVVAKLDGGSLCSALVGTDAIKMSSDKVDKYRVLEQLWLLFLPRIAHVWRSRGDIRAGLLVAKMARLRNSGFVAALSRLCHGYVHVGVKFKSLADETHQYLRNLDDLYTERKVCGICDYNCIVKKL